MLKTFEKSTRICKNPKWLAYCAIVSEETENSQKAPHGLASPYWSPHYSADSLNQNGGEAVNVAASVSYAYDNNGNVTDIGASIDLTWDHMNRMTSWSNGTTSTYSYDHTGERVRKVVSGATTTYPSKFYDTDGSILNKYIYAGDSLIATIEDEGATTTTYHAHLDHLGGTNVTTDEAGAVEQTLDYYPFGTTRIDTGGTDHDERNKFTGHELDGESNLIYAGARYYGQNIGRFMGQDPAVLSLGNTAKVEEKTKLTLEQYLSDPQLLNTYSYTRNNPLKYVDQNGEAVQIAVAIGVVLWSYTVLDTGIDVYDLYITNYKYDEHFSDQQKFESRMAVAEDALFWVAPGIGAAQKSERLALDMLSTSLDIVQSYFGDEVFGDQEPREPFSPGQYLQNSTPQGSQSVLPTQSNPMNTASNNEATLHAMQQTLSNISRILGGGNQQNKDSDRRFNRRPRN